MTLIDGAAALNNSIHYPEFDIPEDGGIVEITNGIFWLRMPLPMQLDHINLYLLEDAKGWYIVDCGIGTEVVTALWKQIFKHFRKKPVIGIIVTHMHPDHIGQAGYLSSRWQAPLLMSRTEYFIGRALAAGPTDADKWTEIDFLRKLGLPEEEVQKLSTPSTPGYSHVVVPLPTSYIRLVEGQRIEIMGRQWEVRVGQGHSPEHICLYCRESKILISGDHILPGISPNIGVYSTEPDADPLSLYLTTLPPFAELPRDTLVLPAHKQPFFGVAERVNQLVTHHQDVLSLIVESCRESQTALALIPIIYKRELRGPNRFFALAECLAHLNYLYYRNMIQRDCIEGVYWYHSANE